MYHIEESTCDIETFWRPGNCVPLRYAPTSHFNSFTLQKRIDSK